MIIPWWEADDPEHDLGPGAEWNGSAAPSWAAAVAGVEEMLARRTKEGKAKARRAKARRAKAGTEARQ
ncbi:hypothetical protein ACFC58_36140 [Kitasatospora purpeofusca]|uniref:hypothetical protein n=1 Tax=Kitasatospora purpeofusca TaxID=67352 RepID=UPI0035D86079